METDAKGQLGGLDTSDTERRAFAERSRGWQCSICGRSNGEILRECENAASEIEKEDKGGMQEEEKVPEGLVIGSREDLGLQSGSKEEKKEEDDTEAELAEGFVQTAPLPAHNSSYPAARPGQTVPQPTGTPTQQSHLTQAPTTARRAQIQQHVSSEGVPIWVDRAIAGIVICLVVMILKMLLGL